MNNRFVQVLNFILVFFFVVLVNAQPEDTGPGVDRLFAQTHSDGAVRVIVELDTRTIKNAAQRSAASLTKKQRIQLVADRLLNRLHPTGKRGVKRFKYLPYVALETTTRGLQEILASPESLAVYEDRKLRPILDDSVPLIGGDTTHAAGFTGLGHAVAILDTGVDRTHPFLSPRVVSEACYSTTSLLSGSTTVCPNGGQSQTGAGAGVPCEVEGCDHGTHVAGIAAGNGTTFDGLARDADIIAIQVFSEFNNQFDCGIGQASCVLAFTSDIIQGLERVFDLHNSFNIAAVNLSLGGGRYVSPCDDDPMKTSFDLLRTAGIATVAASGNNGYTNAINTPACISTALAVGSTTKIDNVSLFSNSSPLVDLLAPGSNILSSVPGGGFATLSGTSMATPHVVGAYAVLRSADPSATIDEILAALKNTGEPIVDSRNGLEKPRIQVDEAIGALGVGVNTELEVSPESDFVASGVEGGPFSPSSNTYTVTNIGTGILDFTVASTANWIALTPDSGSLSAGHSTTVTVATGPAANLLSPGPYSTTVRFIDQSGSSGSEQRTVDLTVSGTGVANDKLADAFMLTAASGSTSGSNSGATKEPGEPDHGENPGGASVWWQWFAEAAGTLTVNTFGSDFDTTLGIYRGNSVSALISLGQNNDAGSTSQSKIDIPVIAGTTYLIAVDGFADSSNPATGSIALNWMFDNTSVGIGDLSVTPEEGFSATGEVGGPFTPGSKTYTFTNTSAAVIDYMVVTSGNFFDADSTGGQLMAGGSETVTLMLNENANQLGPGTTIGSFMVNEISRPVEVTAMLTGTLNDDLAEADVITGALPVSIDATNEGATKEANEPEHADNIGGASVWWFWSAPQSGTAVIDTFGSNFDTLLAIYRGTALDNLVEIASNDDSSSLESRVSFVVASGEQFWIAVDGFNAATGTIMLNLDITEVAQGDPTSGGGSGGGGCSVSDRVGSDLTLLFLVLFSLIKLTRRLYSHG